MKNIAKMVASAIALFTTNIHVNAQVSIGGRFGVTANNVVAPALNNTLSFNQTYNYSAGVVAEIPLGNWLALQPELNYTTKGFGMDLSKDFKIFDINLPLGVKANTKLHYLEVPLLLKAKFGNESVHGYVTAGPTLGYALAGRLVGTTSLLIDVKVYDSSINLNTNGFNRFEVGGLIGGGVAFETGTGQLFLDARYTRGLTQSYEIPVIGTKVMNQGYGLSIGYLHRL
jgi:Outer membrane protein beta-barrel domain